MIRRLPLLILVLLLIVWSLFLTGCPDPRARIFFWKEGKEHNELKWQFDNNLLRLKLTGTRKVYRDSTFALRLSLAVKVDDTAMLDWNNSKAVILINGKPMLPKHDRDTLAYYNSSDKGLASLEFLGTIDPSKIWLGNEKRPVSPLIQIILDSTVYWKGKPIALDTIEAFLKIPSYDFVFSDLNYYGASQR